MLWRMIAPCSHRFERGRAIERAVDLSRREMLGVPTQPISLGNFFRIKGMTPTIVRPTGSPDPEIVHDHFRSRGQCRVRALHRPRLFRVLNFAVNLSRARFEQLGILTAAEMMV